MPDDISFFYVQRPQCEGIFALRSGRNLDMMQSCSNDTSRTYHLSPRNPNLSEQALDRKKGRTVRLSCSIAHFRLCTISARYISNATLLAPIALSAQTSSHLTFTPACTYDMALIHLCAAASAFLTFPSHPLISHIHQVVVNARQASTARPTLPSCARTTSTITSRSRLGNIPCRVL